MDTNARRLRPYYFLASAGLLFLVEWACVRLGTPEQANSALWGMLLLMTMLTQWLLAALAVRNAIQRGRHRVLTVSGAILVFLVSLISGLTGAFMISVSHFTLNGGDSRDSGNSSGRGWMPH